MRLSLRLAFAALLWGSALVPFVLYLVFLQSPPAAVELVQQGRAALRTASLLGLLVLALALLLYPPFFPALRLFWRRSLDRMQVDQSPMLAALADLKHFETAARHMDVARVAARLGKLEMALTHALRAVELDPEDNGARYLLGVLLRRAGRLQDAIGHLQVTVDRDPGQGFGQAQLELAHCLLLAGRDAEALAALTRHGAEHGDSRKSQFWKAQALHSLGKHGECREALEAAAAPPQENARLTLEDALFRARARVALWTWGRKR